MSQLSDVTNAAIKALLGNRSLNSGAAARGTTSANDVKTTATVNYCKNGVFGSVAAAEVDISATTLLNENGGTTTNQSGVPQAIVMNPLADGYSAKYLLCYNGSAWAIVQGTHYANGGTPSYPACPPGYVPIVVVTLVNTSGSSFTFGDASLATTGIADTYENVSVVPSRNAA